MDQWDSKIIQSDAYDRLETTIDDKTTKWANDTEKYKVFSFQTLVHCPFRYTSLRKWKCLRYIHFIRLVDRKYRRKKNFQKCANKLFNCKPILCLSCDTDWHRNANVLNYTTKVSNSRTINCKFKLKWWRKGMDKMMQMIAKMCLIKIDDALGARRRPLLYLLYITLYMWCQMQQ